MPKDEPPTSLINRPPKRFADTVKVVQKYADNQDGDGSGREFNKLRRDTARAVQLRDAAPVARNSENVDSRWIRITTARVVL